MIRRAVADDFLLITQDDHAHLAAQLAEAFGHDRFASPQPPVISAVRLHDSGWPLHDEHPIRNPGGLPLDVFETPRDIALKVWTASVEKAQLADRYAALLVSLHVLALSVLATTREQPAQSWDLDNPADRFAIIKFQQKELERQENLRATLGLRSEKHARHPAEVRQKTEDQLTFDFRLLQAMDVISLAACCTQPPTGRTQELMPRPGELPVHLEIQRRGDDVIVDPWPFGESAIELMIPACRIPAQEYASDDALRAAIDSGANEVLLSRVFPGEAGSP